MRTLEGDTINRETARYKYGTDPMAEYLDRIHDMADDSIGSVDELGHFARFGRRILATDTQGFVDVYRYDTETEAVDTFDAIITNYQEETES